MKTEKDFSREYMENGTEILRKIDKVLLSGRYILGKEVALFEARFADYIGTKYCVGVGSGYDALYLSCLAVNVRGSTVGIIGELHIATTNAVVYAGGLLHYIGSIGTIPDDVDYIIPVFNSSRHARWYKRVKKKRKVIIEDACQAIGGKIKYKFRGHLACFSFHPLKALHCYGDGGAICTNDKVLYKKLKRLRNHGRIGKTMNYTRGVNSRLDEVQAAILNIKLRYLISREKG